MPISSLNLKNLRVNPDWAALPLFDRTGWTTVRFGDVVDNLNETERDPGSAGIERFIGLEHLEPGSLHIRNWGNVADGTTFTRRCRPGQVLFSKRRAYQRKVAVAEFDAVVSGDICVLAPRDHRLLPELLPFLCLSQRFFQHAVGTSAGSLSPRTNWSSLASFEFDLPPLDQQRRIAEVLWAGDQYEQECATVGSAAREYLHSVIESSLDKMYGDDCETIASIWSASPDSGCSAPPSSIETGHYVLSLAAVSQDGYRSGNLKLVEPTPVMLDAKLLKGDFLISRSNTQELVGLVGIFDEDRDDVSFPDAMMRLHVDEDRILKNFLEVVLLSIRGRKHMMKSAAGTSGSMKKINRQTLGQCVVPTPSVSLQQAFLNELDGPLHVVRAFESACTSARSVKEALINGFLR